MQNAIIDYLNSHPAPRLLWLGGDAVYEDVLPDSELISLPITTEILKAIGDEHYDCAVLQALPGALNQSSAEALVARLRDVQAQRILWQLEPGSPWSQQDLLALGFHLLDADEAGNRLYGYDIDNYKQTPDWLSPKNWANPELWDKKRW